MDRNRDAGNPGDAEQLIQHRPFFDVGSFGVDRPDRTVFRKQKVRIKVFGFRANSNVGISFLFVRGYGTRSARSRQGFGNLHFEWVKSIILGMNCVHERAYPIFLTQTLGNIRDVGRNRIKRLDRVGSPVRPAETSRNSAFRFSRIVERRFAMSVIASDPNCRFLPHLVFVAECAVKPAFDTLVYRGEAAHQEIEHGNRSIVVSAFAGAGATFFSSLRLPTSKTRVSKKPSACNASEL